MFKAPRSRRQLLKQLALFGGATVLPSGLYLSGCKRSEGTPEDTGRARRTPHYFVFYYMVGGWDLTSLTDPPPKGSKIPKQFGDGEVFEHGAHRFGPSMRALKPWFKDMAVVRGMRSLALNHPQARFAMVTGQFKEAGQKPAASVQTLLAKHFGKAYPLPNLSSDGLRPAVFLGDEDPHLRPLRVKDVRQFKRLVDVKGQDKHQDEILKAIASRDALLKGARKSKLVDEFTTYAELSRKMHGSDTQRVLEALNPAGVKSSSLVTTKNRWGRQAQLAVETIRYDLAPVITVGSGEFDSHNNHDYRNHLRKVKRGADAVAAILDGLEGHKLKDGKSLLDRTTVVVTSEFSRAPMINELGGKHHWEANSALFFGKGVKKGAVFGATDDGHYPLKVNLKTGRGDNDAEYTLINNALASCLTMAGIDPEDRFDAEPIPMIIDA